MSGHCVQAPHCTLWTLNDRNVPSDSHKWLDQYGGQQKILTQKSLHQLRQGASSNFSSGGAPTSESQVSDPPLRPCQEACLEACAKGARIVEMACGTGKTRVIREMVAKQTGKAAPHRIADWQIPAVRAISHVAA